MPPTMNRSNSAPFLTDHEEQQQEQQDVVTSINKKVLDDEPPVVECVGKQDDMELGRSNGNKVKGPNQDMVVEPQPCCGRGVGGGKDSCGRGIVSDVRSTVGTYWVKEMTNLDQKTIAVSFFLFFAVISPAITFGAVYAKATHNWMGAVEMILATAWVGILYALMGGQPMMINGGTGPVLAFAEILYKMSEQLDVPFLTLNAWIGLWVAFYMILAAFFDWNRIIVFATRFTDEIFSLLIAGIFILNALGSPFSPVGVYYYFLPSHPSHEVHQDNPDYSYMSSALLSLLVTVGTVQLAFVLRKIKFSPFLPSQMMRNVITDFAVVLSILVMTLVATFLFPGVPMETLTVPDEISPTFACCTPECHTNWPDDCPDVMEPAARRKWLVNLLDLNGQTYVPFMAAGPAVLAFILVFLDDGITWHLINNPSHKLTHGAAYNYDTLLIGITVAVNSILGFPWLVAATVRSLNHVHALAEKDASGKIQSVRETRLTPLLIHILTLVSIFTLHVLKLIPMPVLYGVFLFMGLVSLGTNQFWGRFVMLFMQPSKYPVEPYTVHTRPIRMHLFTALQLLLFLSLYFVKSIKAVAIAFPLVIAMCIPMRMYVMPRIFTEKELVMLDSDDAVIKAWLQDHDDTTQHEVEESTTIHPETDDEADKQAMVAAEEEVPPVVATDTTEAERPRRTRRRKSVSCPSPQMLFAEVPYPATSVRFNLEENVIIGTSDSTHHPMVIEEEEEAIGEEISADVEAPESGEMGRPRRRRRAKQVSCPAHLLFNEAERQVAENYFFG